MAVNCEPQQCMFLQSCHIDCSPTSLLCHEEGQRCMTSNCVKSTQECSVVFVCIERPVKGVTIGSKDGY